MARPMMIACMQSRQLARLEGGASLDTTRVQAWVAFHQGDYGQALELIDDTLLLSYEFFGGIGYRFREVFSAIYEGTTKRLVGDVG